MNEWLEAWRYELEAQGNLISKRKAGSRLSTHASETAQVYERALERLSSTGLGKALGEGARKIGGVVNQMPFLTFQTDLLKARQGINSLMERVKATKQAPEKSLALVQLAEGLEDLRRYRLAFRVWGLVINPVASLPGAILTKTASLGINESTVERALRSSYLVAEKRLRAKCNYADLHSIARVYLAQDKPKAALRFALLAATAARSVRSALPEDPPRVTVWTQIRTAVADDGIEGAMDSAGDLLRNKFDRTYDRLTPRERWCRQEGAALVTAARAHLALGEYEMAKAAAAAAVRLHNTMGHAVRARLLPSSKLGLKHLLGRVKARNDLLQMVEARDRLHYSGVVSGDWKIVGETAVSQEDVPSAVEIG